MTEPGTPTRWRPELDEADRSDAAELAGLLAARMEAAARSVARRDPPRDTRLPHPRTPNRQPSSVREETGDARHACRIGPPAAVECPQKRKSQPRGAGILDTPSPRPAGISCWGVGRAMSVLWRDSHEA